jgi:hypothetical protein
MTEYNVAADFWVKYFIGLFISSIVGIAVGIYCETFWAGLTAWFFMQLVATEITLSTCLRKMD